MIKKLFLPPKGESILPRGQNTWMKVNATIGREENKGTFFSLFSLVFVGIRKIFLQNISHSDGKEWPIKAA